MLSWPLLLVSIDLFELPVINLNHLNNESKFYAPILVDANRFWNEWNQFIQTHLSVATCTNIICCLDRSKTGVVDARVQLSRFPLWITKLLYMDSIRHSICLQEGDSFASACPSLASECTQCDCFYSRPLQWPLCSVSAALMTLSDDFMFCQLILNVRFRRKCRCQGGQSVQ